MKHHCKKRFGFETYFYLLLAGLLLFPFLIHAQDPYTYSPFVNIPGFDYSEKDFGELVNALYTLLIVIGATYGVLKIAVAGVKYTTSDVVSSKQSALGDIRGVFFGLAILLIPYLILNTINPNLTRTNVLEGGFGTIPIEGRFDTVAIPSGMNMKKAVCAPTSDTPEGRAACIEELKKNCPDTSSIQPEGTNLVCVYKVAVPKNETRKTCRASETKTIQDCVDELKTECYEKGGRLERPEFGEAVNCIYTPQFIQYECWESETICRARCDADDGIVEVEFFGDLAQPYFICNHE